LNIRGTKLGTIFVDVFDPLVMFLEAIRRDTDHLNISLGEIRRTSSDLSKLRGANRSEITRVGEEDSLAWLFITTYRGLFFQGSPKSHLSIREILWDPQWSLLQNPERYFPGEDSGP
jgi:hypothetical protein